MELGEVKKYYEWETTSRRGQVEIYMAETEDKPRRGRPPKVSEAA